MQNRLKHLESLVKDVMGGQSPLSTTQHEYLAKDSSNSIAFADSDGTRKTSEGELSKGPSPQSGNVLFRPDEKATYVGATHWAAILEDVSSSIYCPESLLIDKIEEVKSYFEEAEEGLDEEDIRPFCSLAFNAATPATKSDLMDALPPRIVVDRFVSRYFNSNSPSLRECDPVRK